MVGWGNYGGHVVALLCPPYALESRLDGWLACRVGKGVKPRAHQAGLAIRQNPANEQWFHDPPNQATQEHAQHPLFHKPAFEDEFAAFF